MGSKQLSVKNTCMDEISNINEDESDISNIDRLQLKAIKKNEGAYIETWKGKAHKNDIYYTEGWSM